MRWALSPGLAPSSFTPFSPVSAQTVRFSDFLDHWAKFGLLYHEDIEPDLPILLFSLLHPLLKCLLGHQSSPRARIGGKTLLDNRLLKTYFFLRIWCQNNLCIVKADMEVSWGEKPIDLNSMIPGRWYQEVMIQGRWRCYHAVDDTKRMKMMIPGEWKWWCPFEIFICGSSLTNGIINSFWNAQCTFWFWFLRMN